MSLQTQLANLATALGTDYKQLRTWISGSASGNLTSLTTTDKTSLIAAINETKAGNSGAPPSATETTAGVVELATLSEVSAGVDTTRAVTVAGVKQATTAVKTEILGGASAAWDTLQELKAFIDSAEETSDITALTTIVGQKANSTDVYTKIEIGNPEADLVAAYTTAKT